ncbi:MAG TPA: hypothetical protein VH599_10550 [Ktedonobacterales bacterium]|jgi:hypothetical protein
MAQSAQQASTKQQQPQKHRQPKRTDLIFHLVKTGRLVVAVLGDRRVSLVRKGAYLGALGLLLLIPLLPEMAAQIVTVASLLLPVEILELPLDGAIDWVTFAVATFSLLKLFPKEIVGEHYDRLFRR